MTWSFTDVVHKSFFLTAFFWIKNGWWFKKMFACVRIVRTCFLSSWNFDRILLLKTRNKMVKETVQSVKAENDKLKEKVDSVFGELKQLKRVLETAASWQPWPKQWWSGRCYELSGFSEQSFRNKPKKGHLPWRNLWLSYHLVLIILLGQYWSSPGLQLLL